MQTSLLSFALFASAVLAGCASALDLDASSGGPDAKPAGAVETPCPDDAAIYAEQLWKPLLSKTCVGCHRDGGLAGGSRLVLSDVDPTVGWAGVVALAKESTDGVSTLVARPSGLHAEGHPGGTLTPPGSLGHARLGAFVDRVAHGVCEGAVGPTCKAGTPGKRRLRRLTRSEIDRSLRDVFGLPATYTAGLVADTVVGGFDNRADASTVAPLFAEQLRSASEAIAATATPGLAPCAPANSPCVEAWIAKVGRRVFRRPLSKDEVARYAALAAAVEAVEPGKGAEAVVAALVQSPHFLYRVELGGEAKDGLVALDPFELASALSYLFWGTTPDDALLDAAATGKLDTPGGRLTEAERLFADAKAREALDAFFSQWLEVGRLDATSKDAAAYPSWDAGLRADMREETRRFVDHVVREKHGTFADLFASRTTFAGGGLAKLYGLGGTSWSEVSLEGTTRAGLLTQASVLAVHGHAAGSSPIHRGKLVRERVLCEPLPPPPPSLNVEPPPVDPSLSTRERFAAHAKVEPCVSCHRKIDPIGYAFEGFDGIGAARTMDGTHPVDTQTDILDAGTVSGPVTGAVELADKLAKSPEARACFASQWVRWGYGVDEEEELSCLTAALRDGFRDGDGSIEQLLFALVASPHFTTRLADDDLAQPTMGTGGAAGAGGASGAAGATPMAGSGGGAGAPSTTGDLDVTSTVDTTWQGGECRTVKVTNAGASKTTWSVTVDVGGTLSDVWNAKASPAGGTKQTFVGLDWNGSLAPKATASFGFCVTK